MSYKTPEAATPIDLLSEIFLWPRATEHVLHGEEAMGSSVGHFGWEGRGISLRSPGCGVGWVTGQLDLRCVTGFAPAIWGSG